jgi:hypothetical protein
LVTNDARCGDPSKYEFSIHVEEEIIKGISMKEKKALHTVYTKAFLLLTAEITERRERCLSIVFITNDLPTMKDQPWPCSRSRPSH